MNIIENYLTKNRCYTNANKINIKGLCLHSTGSSNEEPTKYFNAFNNASVSKDVHAFIKYDGTVYNTLPWNYKAWHGGSGKNGSVNSSYIGVEMCEPSTIKYIGGTKFIDNNPEHSRAVVVGCYNTAVKLFAWLCKQFNLNPSNPGVITSHYEAAKLGLASKHADPGHLFPVYGLSMDQFRLDVINKYNSQNTVVTPTPNPVVIEKPVETPPVITPTEPKTPSQQINTPTINYLASVNVDKGDTLNVRSEPNGKEIINKLGRGFIVNVVGKSGQWSKLSTGGYVYDKYLKDYPEKDIYIDRFIVQLKANLNIRSAPVIANNIINTANKNLKLTIVGVKNSFGLLYSGAGWITMDPRYVTRL